MTARHPQLNNPPIVEVVCGFIFDPMPLSMLDFGVYWERRRAELPKYSIQPRVEDGPAFRFGVEKDLRVWLIDEAEEFLLQLQNDRLYVNWRKGGEGLYPRFSDHDAGEGLKSRALRELKQYVSFAEERVQRRVTLQRLELTKIDELRRGVDYQDIEGLGSILPVTQVFQQICATHPSQLSLQLSEEQNDEATTQVSVAMGEKSVRIETRHIFANTHDPADGLTQANLRVNEVFFGLVNTVLLESR